MFMGICWGACCVDYVCLLLEQEVHAVDHCAHHAFVMLLATLVVMFVLRSTSDAHIACHILLATLLVCSLHQRS